LFALDPFIKTVLVGLVAHYGDSSIQDAEAGGLTVGEQPGLYETKSQKKKKKKKTAPKQKAYSFQYTPIPFL
jgi:hypothetical protein